MLAITINRDQDVVVMCASVLESRVQSGTLSLIFMMAKYLKILAQSEKFRSTVAGTIVHDKYVTAILTDLIQDFIDVAELVVDWQSGEQTLGHQVLDVD